MKPLILRDHEVRRLLDVGSVVVVREVQPHPPAWADEGGFCAYTPLGYCTFRGLAGSGLGAVHVRLRHGVMGEQRWVRETWANLALPSHPPVLVYRADGATADGVPLPPGVRWRAPAQMPRWASRAVVEVASVRVCRVRDLTLDDIEATGACVDMVRRPKPGDPKRACGRYIRPDGRPVYSSADGCLRVAWDEQRGATKYANDPWAWVVSVSRVEAT